MPYNTHLPESQKSWAAFYEQVQKLISPYDEFVHWVEYRNPPMSLSQSFIPTETVASTRLTYQVRFIEQKVIAELSDQVRRQTFSLDELRYLQRTNRSMQAYGYSPDIAPMNDKLVGMIKTELEKQ